jgi:hypothetical protein
MDSSMDEEELETNILSQDFAPPRIGPKRTLIGGTAAYPRLPPSRNQGRNFGAHQRRA